jgi:hypothetical protein
MFADVCGSTSIYETKGDVVASRIMGDCLGVLASITVEHRGVVIKTIGDEIMAEFPTADDAIEAAIDMQTRRRGDDPLVKIGFHIGPVLRRDGDLYGDTVNMAARVVSRATSRDVLMTGEAVLAMSRAHRERARWFDNASVKGISRTVSLFRYPTEIDNIDLEVEHRPTTLQPVIPNGIDASAASFLTLKTSRGTVTFKSTDGAMDIGRNPDCGLVIEGRGVSRHHAKISWERDRFVLEDTSTNGTFIARQDETPHLLKRQVLPLFGHGSISLGVPPSSTRDSGIQYTVYNE